MVRRPFDVNYITVMINWTGWSGFTCRRHRSNSKRLHGDKNGILFNDRSGARETINSRTDSFVGIMAEIVPSKVLLMPCYDHIVA